MFITKLDKKWWILIAMTGSLAMILADQVIVCVALPTIRHELNISPTMGQWIISSYLLAFAVMLTTGGKIGDIIGKAQTFILGATLFAVASIFCGIANSGEALLVSRIFQGIGAAFMQPASSAIVNTSFNLNERGKAIAIYGGISICFMALAPVIGGFLTEYVSWGWIFFINIPVAACSIILTLVLKPKKEIIKNQKIDFLGIAFFLLCSTSLVLAIQEGNNWGWSSPTILSLIFSGVILLMLFIYVERKQEHPLINFDFFKEMHFSTDIFILFVTQFALLGQAVFLPIYLQTALGFSPFQAGSFMIIIAVTALIGAQYAGRFFDKHGIKKTAIIALTLLLVAYLSQAPLLLLRNIYFCIPGIMLLAIGDAFIIPPTIADTLNRIPRKKRGQAAGILQTARQMGAAIGIAVMTAAIYGTEHIKLTSLTAKLGIGSDKVSLLTSTLVAPLTQQKAILKTLVPNWKETLHSLQQISASSISVSYYICGALILVSLIAAISFMSSGVQTKEQEE